MASSLTYNATLASKRLVSNDVGVFRVIPDTAIVGEGPWFVPGQYVTLGINPGGGEDPIRRPMTVVSSATERGEIEFYLNRVEKPRSQHPLTHLLWQLSPGDALHMRNHPAGRFTISDTVGIEDTRLRLCLGQGTGVAPFVSMVRSCDNQSDFAERYALIHGAADKKLLSFHDEMTEIETRSGLRYIPIVDSHLPGQRGRACDLVSEEQIGGLETTLGMAPGRLCPETTVVYVCGLQPDIACVIWHLLARGFVPHHRKICKALEIGSNAPATLFFEQYDNERIFDINDAGVVQQLRARFPKPLL